MIAAVLVSDIHLTRAVKGPLDINIELRNGLIRFLPKLVERFPDISLLLICGDVAFEASEREYATAAGFIRDIQAPLDGPRVLVVPGNHDIHLDTADLITQRVWRGQPRMPNMTVDERDKALTALLSEAPSATGLFEPLAAYNAFAAAYRCDVSASEPCWTVHLPIDTRYELQLRGMTSVLLSDRFDEVNRLLLGSVQVADLEAESPGVVTVTLCHHPYNWFLDGAEQRDKLRSRSILHITGHEHDHAIHTDEDTGSVHLCLGALQPTRGDDWDPRVYGLGVDVDESGTGAEAVIDIFGARWDGNRFVADVDVRRRVPLLPPEGGEVPPPPRSVAKTIVRLTERLAALPTGDRLEAARSIGVELGNLVDSPSYRLPSSVVRHAIQDRRLHLLWDEVARLHGNQSGEDNPFEESE